MIFGVQSDKNLKKWVFSIPFIENLKNKKEDQLIG